MWLILVYFVLFLLVYFQKCNMHFPLSPEPTKPVTEVNSSSEQLEKGLHHYRKGFYITFLFADQFLS